MLWGTTIITPVVPNMPLGLDVLAFKVEGYQLGHSDIAVHSNIAVFSTVPVSMNSQRT